MATKGKANARLTKDLLETAKDMRASGTMDKAAHEKITMRHLSSSKIPPVAPIKGDDIRALREKAHLSQAVFARYLNLTVGCRGKGLLPGWARAAARLAGYLIQRAAT